MIVCRKCGFKNVDSDSFCGSCGTFLEWTGEKVERKVDAEVLAAAEEEAGKPKQGLISKIQSVLYLDVGERDAIERPVKPGMGGGLGGPGGRPGAPGGAAGGAGGLPKPPGLGGPPKPPGLGGLPKPPGLGGPPKPPGLGGLPRPPGLGALPKLPSLDDDEDDEPNAGGLPKLPGLGGLPKPPGLGGLPKLPSLDDDDDDDDDDEDEDEEPRGRGGLPKLPGLGGVPKPPGLGGLPKLPSLDDDDDDEDDDLLPEPPRLGGLPKLPSLDDDDEDEDDDSDDDGFGSAALPKPSVLSGLPKPFGSPPPRLPTASAAALVAPLPPAGDDPDESPVLVAAGAQVQPAEAQPGAIAPQEKVKQAAVITKTKPTRRLEPGDLICGECGEGNVRTRKFCSRCGTSLVTAEVAKKRWWHALRYRRSNRVLKAGQRPGRDGVKKKRGLSLLGIVKVVRVPVAIVMVLLGILYGLVMPFRQAVDSRVDAAKQSFVGLFTAQYDPVRPVQVIATSEVAGHEGTDATDGFTNTYWAAASTIPDPTLEVTFDHPVDLAKAIVRNGSPDNFQAQDRVRVLHVVYSTGKTEDITLTDQPDEQNVSFKNGQGITQAEIHLQTPYRAIRGTEVRLSEIEFFVEQ
ncbi:hypothetical protein OG439_08075 [Amycolatopsis sp. NBC_01307]|uniref:NADase-type glycan-binding domain-containing protein n=1 Tax=Amycolatopsis sp. NBC_01307 TaxID=2903561 RepID=UPI002E11F860|nr:hypothetical protein OG439_08075 [Amycolatopsis sp. NBC_01307]